MSGVRQAEGGRGWTEQGSRDRFSALPSPGSFHKGVAEGEVDPAFGPLEALRLSIQTDSPVWVILSEVRQDRAGRREHELFQVAAWGQLCGPC